MLGVSLFVEYGWITNFDGVVWIRGRQAQDSRGGVDFADVSYCDGLNVMLARLGCCAVLVRDGIVDY